MKHEIIKTIGQCEIGKMYYDATTGKNFYLVEKKKLGPTTIQVGYIVINYSFGEKYKYKFVETKSDTKLKHIYEVVK